jgi:uncharacterized membrane protein
VTGERRLGLGLVLGGSVGLLAAAVLLVERFRLAEDPTYVPSCSVNPVLSCGSVMETWQASLLGFPNPVIGVAAFPVVITTGMALLAGATFGRWYWRGLQAGVLAGLALVLWLVVQSLAVIGALCPYCMVVWAVVWPLAWYVTLRNAGSGVLGERVAQARWVAVVREWHGLLLLLPYAALVLAITVRFWSFWTG